MGVRGRQGSRVQAVAIPRRRCFGRRGRRWRPVRPRRPARGPLRRQRARRDDRRGRSLRRPVRPRWRLKGAGSSKGAPTSRARCGSTSRAPCAARWWSCVRAAEAASPSWFASPRAQTRAAACASPAKERPRRTAAHRAISSSRSTCEPHPFFRRGGRRPAPPAATITVSEAYKGAKVKVPTIDGSVTLKVPPRSQSGGRPTAPARQGRREEGARARRSLRALRRAGPDGGGPEARVHHRRACEVRDGRSAREDRALARASWAWIEAGVAKHDLGSLPRGRGPSARSVRDDRREARWSGAAGGRGRRESRLGVGAASSPIGCRGSRPGRGSRARPCSRKRGRFGRWSPRRPFAGRAHEASRPRPRRERPRSPCRSRPASFPTRARRPRRRAGRER